MHFGLAVHWPARPFVSRSPISIVCDLYEWLKLFLLFYFIVVFVFCCRCWWEINEWTNEASTVSINEWTNEWMSVHATCMHGCVCVCVKLRLLWRLLLDATGLACCLAAFGWLTGLCISSSIVAYTRWSLALCVCICVFPLIN